ncbi:hypothetical protein OJAV_G00237190 [Oryzias javanicus]|uniref:Uncharacterized protein n=1 Tax=Oryzias javanicus TaxID=123683 RepID=A0A3S2LWP5_ORYJA|nr:hypothetical protein OJAV_G00237190 [Oryzias javanicus]
MLVSRLFMLAFNMFFITFWISYLLMLTGEELFHFYMKRICQTFKKWLTTSCISLDRRNGLLLALSAKPAWRREKTLGAQRVVLDTWAQPQNERTGESRRRATT